MSRSDIFRRAAAYVERLRDGRPRRLMDLADIAPGPKTLRRDLAALEDVPGVTVTRRGRRTWYRLGWPAKDAPAKKRCTRMLACGGGPHPIGNFGKNSYSPDGHDWACRKCRSAMRLNWLRKGKNRELTNKKQRRNYAKRKKNND